MHGDGRENCRIKQGEVGVGSVVRGLNGGKGRQGGGRVGTERDRVASQTGREQRWQH